MRTIDTIGIIINLTPVTSVNIKSTGIQKDRRNVTIIDDSSQVIQCTLWGTLAGFQGLEENEVLAVKCARVSEYAGTSLNAGDEHS
jgi:replication factor A1